MPQLKDLESRHTLEIIKFLLDHGEAKREEVRKNISGSNTTINSVLAKLERLGLTRERREKPQLRFIRLSAMGLEVAQRIKEIEEIFKKSP